MPSSCKDIRSSPLPTLSPPPLPSLPQPLISNPPPPCPHRRRPSNLPPNLRLRPNLPQHPGLMPAPAPPRNAPDALPAAEKGLRRVQAWHGGYAQALQGQSARGR